MAYETASFPHYTERERLADAGVHVVGLALAVVFAPLLLAAAAASPKPYALAATAVYAAALIGMLAASAAYNMSRPSALKARLRRFDHCAIFLKIAGAYTPICLLVIGGAHGMLLLAAVWLLGLGGVALKLRASERIEPLSVPLYIALGWAIVFCAQTLLLSASMTTMALFAAGGLTYSVGVVFHLWNGLPYQNAIWHGFVLLGSGFIFAANYAAL